MSTLTVSSGIYHTAHVHSSSTSWYVARSVFRIRDTCSGPVDAPYGRHAELQGTILGVDCRVG